MSEPRVFLDLEDTVITPDLIGDFSDVYLINIGKVRALVEKIGPKKIDIFSYAVHGDICRHRFYLNVAEALKTAMGLEIGIVPTVHEIKKVVNAKNRISDSRCDLQDFITFWGKERGFIEWAIAHFKRDADLYLIDDTVNDVVLNFSKLQLKMTLINVDNL